ncbi:hypothetical protein ONE63_007566 [Megalurothrips usitatus]|uniref:LRRCT domain-containing protein n=1 Tax=Megalurothrips usitatus TaxID=439358 RepID=A0AAV7XUN2_9NEOP|nr:hypothetical protein ONE63_007566 [Megalurothrips usitatus]
MAHHGWTRALLTAALLLLAVHQGQGQDAVKVTGAAVGRGPAAPSSPATTTATAAPTPTPQHQQDDLGRRLQRLQEQRRLCARCDCFALRRDDGNATVRIPLDENLDDVEPTAPARAHPPPSDKQRPSLTAVLFCTGAQVLVINCTSRLLAEELPRWSWPARLSLGEAVAAETWAEFRGGDLSGVARLPHLPFRLTRLSLADNRLRTVAARAFANLAALRDLDLSHNLIADVPHDAFLGMSSLQRLNLSRNSLSSRPLSADLFKELGQLTRVSLSHNKLTGDINGDTLPWSGSIRELDLSYNELTGVSAGAWRRLPSIQALDLSHNKLQSLTPDAFSELRSLERLDLSWNALTTLRPGSLSGLGALRALDMSHNGLTGAGGGSPFAPLAGLASLDLSWNALSGGSLPVLSALPDALRALDLSHNPLGRDGGGLEGQRDGGVPLPAALQDLSLAGCGLQDLDVRAWGGLRGVRALQLSGNDISVLTDVAHLDALRVLNVSRNSLTRFPTVLLPALAVLDVSHNQLERAPAPLAPRLAALLLDDNPMEELRLAAAPPTLALLSVQNMSHLRAVPAGAVRLAAAGSGGNSSEAPACLSVLLRHNPALREVHEDAFHGVRLCRLDLSHNALQSLSPKLTNWSSAELGAPDLQGNPWACTCALQWVLDTVVRGLYGRRPELLDDLRCASPGPVAGRRLVHWFNHTGRALCDGELADMRAAGMVTFRMPLATLAVVVAAGAGAIALVLVGILVHRRYAVKRRARNRRF